MLAAGLDLGAYVELVGLVSQANCVDRFADALDLPRLTLPEPVDAEPEAALGEDVAMRHHWVPTDRLRGPNVLRALSMVPLENESRGVLSAARYVGPEARLGRERASVRRRNGRGSTNGGEGVLGERPVR